MSLIAGVMAVVPAFASTTVVYVDAGATGSNNGTSWVDAFTDLQLALQPASPGTEIWVASGTYKPGNNRAAAFVLKDGVALYGGFAGGETSLSQRDPGTNLTVLSGDIGIPGDSSDNSYHVLVGSGTNNSALLDGFVVRGGKANGSPPDDRGGGIYAYQGEPFLANTTFENNSASLFGGGVFIGGDLYSPEITSYPVLKDLVIKNNSRICSLVYYESAARFGVQYRPTAVQRKALEAVQEIANRPELMLTMDFQEGDSQLINNHTMMHAREAYADYDEPGRQRHLLRMWIAVPDARRRPLAAALADRYRWVRAGGIPLKAVAA